MRCARSVTEKAIEDIVAYAVGRATLGQRAGDQPMTLAPAACRGVDREGPGGLRGGFEIRSVFNKWTSAPTSLGGALKIPAERFEAPGFDLLSALGFTRAESRPPTFSPAAPTLEGAPH